MHQRSGLADPFGGVLIGWLGCRRLGRASLLRDQAFKSQSLAIGHAAEAVAGDELTWRGRCVAQAARQVRGLAPWRPTGIQLLECCVSQFGNQPSSGELSTMHSSILGDQPVRARLASALLAGLLH
jgi:hypothetical protein